MSDGLVNAPGREGGRADELVARLEPAKPIPPARADEAVEPDPDCGPGRGPSDAARESGGEVSA